MLNTPPETIYREASEHHVGKPLKSYRNKKELALLILALALFVISTYSLIYSIYDYHQWQSRAQSTNNFFKVCPTCTESDKESIQNIADSRLQNKQSEIWLSCLPLLVSLAIFLLYWPERKKRLYLCSEGLLFTNGKQTKSIRWDEVEEVTSDTASCTLKRADESTFPIESGLINSERWKVIENRLEERLRPSMLERYERGETLNFGDLLLDTHGIKRNGYTNTWHEVADARIEGQRIALKIGNEWERLPGKIPLAQLCVELIQHARGGV
ncbi:hypothetical protein KSD_62730 [Ktedonobacter sp. SOSP1-85]|uniref:DUF6585 family protein n=1 Tax=Ktedonobacter sp. SOSP1-85 TaxID=2778367 RepID=UPI001915BA24|nr:DUF6585 family protein [Ktedonobacter sp. SOSP1-85]GHO78502.1 hypothetical protein KSD_62730 [Ktedonobacter sp. SOSP1-85]